MIRVFIIDDSALVRETIKEILSADPEIEIAGTAHNPISAMNTLPKAKPDVLILDIQMPEMDGLTYLKKIMQENPMPVVICSSLTQNGSREIIDAFAYGAVEVITKPKIGTKRFIEESRVRFIDAVKAASIAKLSPSGHSTRAVPPKLTADVILAAPADSSLKTFLKLKNTPMLDPLIAVGASTGGTEALRVFLKSLPESTPGIAVVQHMPENFTRAFADQLNRECSITIREAENSDELRSSLALIAPGNRHMLVKRKGFTYYVEIKDGPLVNRHRPSVDVLFRSAARYAGANAIGVIMTGMGDDGAQGLLEMKNAGAYTIAQDEQSSVVFGMPKEAIKRGAADRVVPLHEISSVVINLLNRKSLNK